MMRQTPLKTVLFLFLSTALFSVTACGVKGPPEPPLANEASVKRAEGESAGSANTSTDQEPAATPVIFPVKKDVKEKAPKKTDKEKTDKQGQ